MATFNTDNWPLIKIIFKDVFNDCDFKTYVKCFNICLNDAKKINKKISLLLDVRKLNMQSPTILYKQVNFLIENDKLISEVVSSSVILISTPITKSIINFIFRFKQPKKPNLITLDINEGIKFLKKHNKFLNLLDYKISS